MDDKLLNLSTRWNSFIQSIGSCSREQSNAVFLELQKSYNSPPRAYHNINHIADCLGLYDRVRTEPNNAIELAIWYHDAIYKPLSTTNEQDSADLLRAVSDRLGFDKSIVKDAERLVLITAHHKMATAFDEQMLADIDCSILATDPRRYDQYAKAVRSEYAEVIDSEYRAGRLKFLDGVLFQRAIFHTQWAHELDYDNRARLNISREINQLEE